MAVGTLASLSLFRKARDVLYSSALGEVADLYKAIDFADPAEAERVLSAVLPELSAEYGQAVSHLAANRYDLLRDVARVPGRYSALVAPPADAGQVLSRVRWALLPGIDEDPSAVWSNLTSVLDKTIKQPGRNTIDLNTLRDPAGHVTYARVPSGAEPCSFCLVLASQGAVYGSAQKAQYAEHGGKYHNDCSCEPTPVWGRDRSTLPSTYRPDDLYSKVYQPARGAAENPGDLNSVLAAMREQHPGMH